MDWPTVWILLQTYKRTQAAIDTTKSLIRYLKYPKLHFHICDDGSGEADDGSGRRHIDVIAEVAKEGGYTVTAHEMDRQGGDFRSACNLGGSLNRGVQIAHENGADVHLMVLDDWALRWSLDIRPHVDALVRHSEVGMIRYGYIVAGLGAAIVALDMAEGAHHRYQYWRLIRKWCLEGPYGHADPYLICMMAYLAHYRFFEAYGWIPEHQPPGETEVNWVWQYNNHPLGESGPQILVPLGHKTMDSHFVNIADRGKEYAAFSRG